MAKYHIGQWSLDACAKGVLWGVRMPLGSYTLHYYRADSIQPGNFREGCSLTY